MSQLLKDDNGFEYYNELPDNFRPCTDLHQFYQLKSGKKEWKKENVQLIVGLEYLIYSPDTKKYELYRVNHEFFHVKNLIQYIQDGNLYTSLK